MEGNLNKRGRLERNTYSSVTILFNLKEKNELKNLLSKKRFLEEVEFEQLEEEDADEVIAGGPSTGNNNIIILMMMMMMMMMMIIIGVG